MTALEGGVLARMRRGWPASLRGGNTAQPTLTSRGEPLTPLTLAFQGSDGHPDGSPLNSQTGAGMPDDAAYRVEIQHVPDAADDLLPWRARIHSTSNGYLKTRWAASRDEALKSARAWIKAQAELRDPEELLLDQNGDIVHAPDQHSVKA